MDKRFPFSPAEVVKVRRVQFGILSPDEIRHMSEALMEHGETMERGKPKSGGLSDPRLGAIDGKTKCETCKGGLAECSGHFGHLELAKPMFHISFLNTVLAIMGCVCFNCSKILAAEEDALFKQALKIRNPKSRLKRIYDACKRNKKCGGGDDIDLHRQQDSEEPIKKSRGGCGALQPHITIDGMKMVDEYKALKKKSDDQEQLPEPVERKQALSAERVLSVLKRISDEDCQLLGLNPKYARPDWMILQVLPIPPPPVRPFVMMDSASRCEGYDDIPKELLDVDAKKGLAFIFFSSTWKKSALSIRTFSFASMKMMWVWIMKIGMMRRMVNGLHQPFQIPSTRNHGSRSLMSPSLRMLRMMMMMRMRMINMMKMWKDKEHVTFHSYL